MRTASLEPAIASLTARNLWVKASGLVLLDNVSLSARRGELIGVIGPSGAGKSTLIKALCGFDPADKGQVLYNRDNLYQAFDTFRQRIGYVPQDDIIHPSLSVFKTLHYAAQLRSGAGMDPKAMVTRINGILQSLELAERRNVKVKRLSGGQRKRVSIGVELVTSPDVMFLDEPTSGLDPGLEAKLMALLKQLAGEGRMIFVTTHVMKSLDTLDLILLMVKGKLAYYGPPGEIIAYFGTDSLHGIFDKLGQQTPEAWKQKFLTSPLHSRYAMR